MSDETKPYDPWEVTDADAILATNKFWQCEADALVNVVAAACMAAALKEDRDRLRARLEATPKPATPKPEPHHDKPWVKIGIRVFNPSTGQSYCRVDRADAPEVSTSNSEDRWHHAEAIALWDHLTNPVRCVDLTPGQPT
jgi:hypothetical protein